MDWGSIPLLAWGAFAFSTFLGFIFTNILWITAIDAGGHNRASLYANLQVFGGVIGGVLLLGERLTALQIVGGVIIAGGILLAARRFRLPRGPVAE
jgi:drug/metabolite transporter (DMT)-like permease